MNSADEAAMSHQPREGSEGSRVSHRNFAVRARRSSTAEEVFDVVEEVHRFWMSPERVEDGFNWGFFVLVGVVHHECVMMMVMVTALRRRIRRRIEIGILRLLDAGIIF